MKAIPLKFTTISSMFFLSKMTNTIQIISCNFGTVLHFQFFGCIFVAFSPTRHIY